MEGGPCGVGSRKPSIALQIVAVIVITKSELQCFDNIIAAIGHTDSIIVKV